jgi:ribosomal subunit interface protein
MQTDVQITFRDMPPSEAVEQRIRERVAKLEEFHDRITACRVVVESARRRQKGIAFQVRIDLTLPGEELAISRDHLNRRPADDIYVAVRNAFDAMERRLKGTARRRRGEVKSHAAAPHGRIARLFPDHGFIGTPAGDVYFHRNSVAEGAFESFEIGDEVRYALAPDPGEHGLQASTVHPIGKRHIVERSAPP